MEEIFARYCANLLHSVYGEKIDGYDLSDEIGGIFWNEIIAKNQTRFESDRIANKIHTENPSFRREFISLLKKAENSIFWKNNLFSEVENSRLWDILPRFSEKNPLADDLAEEYIKSNLENKFPEFIFRVEYDWFWDHTRPEGMYNDFQIIVQYLKESYSEDQVVEYLRNGLKNERV